MLFHPFVQRISACLLATCALLGLFACAPDPVASNNSPLQLTVSPAPANSAQPHLATGVHGRVVMSWLQSGASDVALYAAVLAGPVWDEPRRVASGSDWFVNWADFPSVVPIADQLWAAHWLVKKPGGTYAYDVAMALSTDAGVSWSEPMSPHRDNTAAEHGFVSLFSHQGGVGAVWLDGRNTVGADHDHAGRESPLPASQMTLRAAVVHSDLSLANEVVLDERVCDCCQTDALAGPAGPLVVYRDRSPGEVRDIALVGATDTAWKTPATLPADGWEINGCPVNGPALARNGDAVGVAWYTGADDVAKVRFVRSLDSGAFFGPPLQVDGANALGRVDVVVFDDHGAAVSWIRKVGDDRGALMVRYIRPDGTMDEPLELHPISPSRASGFPQMVRRDADLVFAWTEVDDRGTHVRTAVLADARESLMNR